MGVRINWLKTRGIRTPQQGQMSDWEFMEQIFRRALFAINGLSRQERREFVELARQYLAVFDADLAAVR